MGKSERGRAAEAWRRQQAAEARRRKTVFGVAIGAAVLLIGGLLAVGIWLNREPEREINEPSAATTGDYAVRVGDGPVVVDLYVDYLCPACKQFEATYAEDLQGWVDDGSVTVNYHPIAILDRLSEGTEYSTRAASAAVCAADVGEQEFLDFTVAMYEGQPAENTPGLSDEEIKAVGSGVGLGADWEACVDEESYAGWVGEGTEHATSDQGVQGTPTARVDGEDVELAAFADEVEAAIAAES
ncbi:DsbA family protein [Glycomyces xiaoerkulensis]|uniref:DsbA family protein n=1 Tax=Glycomyces xiaoerkulensis TaxID=2038139 RepID=UPI000C25F0DB|nr:thioredoxin domain-containing protein [Glycomyces xiaoerkulensis]